MKQSDYDDDALILLIARGDKTYGQIAAEVGLSECTVGRIARGDRRPELQPRIQAATKAFVDEARRAAIGHARKAIDRLVALTDVGEKTTAAALETARKAAGDLLKYACGDPEKPDPAVAKEAAGRLLGDLKPEDVRAFCRWKAEQNGGPKQ